MGSSQYAKSLIEFLEKIDGSLNTHRASVVVVVDSCHLHDNPVEYIPRITPFMRVCVPDFVDKVVKSVAPVLALTGDIFLIFESRLLTDVQDFQFSRPSIDPTLLLWDMAIARIWVRVQFIQLLIAICAGMNTKSKSSLFLSTEEMWRVFRGLSGVSVSKETFEGECDKVVSRMGVRKGDSDLVDRNLECKLVASISMKCGNEKRNLDFLRQCRQISLAKAIGPWT